MSTTPPVRSLRRPAPELPPAPQTRYNRLANALNRLWNALPKMPAPIEGAGRSLVKGASDSLQATLTDPLFRKAAHETIHALLLAPVSEEIVRLKELLVIAESRPRELESRQIETLDALLDTLLALPSIEEADKAPFKTLKGLLTINDTTTTNPFTPIAHTLQQLADNRSIVQECMKKIEDLEKQKGNLRHAADFLGELLQQMKGELTNEETGILKEVSKWIQTHVDDVFGDPHPDLLQLQKDLEACQKAFREFADPADPIAAALETARACKAPLSNEQAKKLRAMITYFESYLEGQGTGLTEKDLTKWKEFVDALCPPQKGHIPRFIESLLAAKASPEILELGQLLQAARTPTQLTRAQLIKLRELLQNPTIRDKTPFTALQPLVTPIDIVISNDPIQPLEDNSNALIQQRLQGNQAIVEQCIEALAPAIKGGLLEQAADIVEKHVDRIEQRVTRKPHAKLLALKEKLEECQKRFDSSHACNDAVYVLAREIEANKADIFTTPLTQEEQTQFTALIRYFTTVHAHTNPEYTREDLARWSAVVNGICAKQSGLVTVLFDRVENLPVVWIENVKKALGIATAPDSASDPKDAIGSILDSLGNVFKEGFVKGKAIVSQQAIASLADMLLQFMRYVNGQIDDDYQQKTQLSQLIYQIENENRRSLLDLSRLRTHFRELISICDTMNINVNGAFYIPHFNDYDDWEDMDDTSHYALAQDLASAHTMQAVNAEPTDWQEKAREEKDIFIENTANFIALQYFYESICRTPKSRQEYLVMMATARDEDSSLKDVIFADLKEQYPLSAQEWRNFAPLAWRMFCAWFIYTISHSLIQWFIKRATDAYFNEAFAYIQDQKRTQFKSFTAARITNASKFLEILSSAFDSVAKDPMVTGDLNDMIQKSMEHPERNYKQSVDEIYNTVANNVIDKGFGNYKVAAWIFKKIIRNKHQKVKDLVDTGTQSLQDIHGYADAFNSALIELLEGVEKSIRSSTGVSAETPLIISLPQKEVLTALIENLFDVLKKSECTTLPKLRKLLKEEKPNSNLMDAVNEYLKKNLGLDVEGHVANEVIQSATLMLAESLNKLVKADKLQELTHNLIKNLNAVYEPAPENEDGPQREERARREERERQQREIRVQTLTTSILRKSISNAVNERLDPTVEQQQVNGAIATLREKSHAWIDATEAELRALSRSDLRSEQDRQRIRTLHQNSERFHNEQEAAKTDISIKEWLQINKGEVLKRYQDMAKASKPLTTMIKKLETASYLREKSAFIVPEFRRILALLERNSSKQIRNHLDTLSKHLPANMYDALNKDCTAYRNSMKKRTAITAQREWLEDLPNRIEEIIDNKPNSRLITALTQEITARIAEQPQRKAFLNKLKEITSAAPGAEDPSAFHNLQQAAILQVNRALDEQTSLIETHKKAIVDQITHTRLLEEGYIDNLHHELQDEMQQAQMLVRQYRESCEKHLIPVRFVNSKPVDQRSLKRGAKSIVYNVLKGYTDEMIRFVSRKGLRHALLHHMVLIPNNKYEEQQRKAVKPKLEEPVS